MVQPKLRRGVSMEIRDNCRVRVFAGGEYVTVMKQLLAGAQGEILVAQYAWIWYHHSPQRRVHQITLAALAAARRGVKMRVLLNREQPRHRLTQENVKMATRLGEAGAKVKLGRLGVVEHAKFWVIDKRVLVTCSHNLSTRSVTANAELGVVVYSELAARDAARYFERLWGGL